VFRIRSETAIRVPVVIGSLQGVFSTSIVDHAAEDFWQRSPRIRPGMRGHFSYSKAVAVNMSGWFLHQRHLDRIEETIMVITSK